MTETPPNNRKVRRLASSSSSDPLLGGLFNFVDRDDLIKVGSTHRPPEPESCVRASAGPRGSLTIPPLPAPTAPLFCAHLV